MDLNSLINLLTLGGAMLLSVAVAVFVGAWLTPRIRPEVPAVQSGTLALASALGTGVAWLTATPRLYVVVAVLMPVFLASAWVDSKTKRIPNAYVIESLFLSVLIGVWMALNPDTPNGWWIALLWAVGGAGATFVVFLILNIVSAGGFGAGDVKLGAVMAFTLLAIVLGPWRPEELTAYAAPMVFVLILVGWCTLSFAIGAGWVLIRGLLKTNGGFPFGPCLVIAWIIVVGLTPLVQLLAHELVG